MNEHQNAPASGNEAACLKRLVRWLADRSMAHIEKLPDDAEVFVRASVWGKLAICLRLLRATPYAAGCCIICSVRPSLWSLVR